jgi:hypothetical protein
MSQASPQPASPAPSVDPVAARAQRLAYLGRLLVLLSGGCAVALALALAVTAVRGLPAQDQKDAEPQGAPSAPGAIYGPTEPSDPHRLQVSESDAEAFLIVVESVPDSARVHINGVDQGLTPSSSTPECELGKPVQVVVSRAGYAPQRYSTTCRAKRLIHLYVPLKRARSGS